MAPSELFVERTLLKVHPSIVEGYIDMGLCTVNL